MNVFAGASDGQLVQQGEEACGQPVHQVFRVAVASACNRLLCPCGKGLLGCVQRLLDAGNAGGWHQRVITPLRHQIKLVAQVLQIVIDWRGGQQHHLGFDPGLNDVLHQALVTALLDDNAFLIAFAFDVVTEVVRFVNHHQIEVAPVDSSQVNVASPAGLSG